MIKPVLIFIVLCFCATSAFSRTPEVLGEMVIGSIDQWDSAGSDSKPALLIDQDDGTYIIGGAADDTDLYVLPDLVLIDDDDIIDSVWFWYYAREQSNGNNRMEVKLIVGTNESATIGAVLSTSLTGYEDFFTEQPAGGAWTAAAIDSLEVQLEATQIGSAAWVAECSTKVFYHDYTMLYLNITDGCQSGSNFGKQMDFRKDVTPDTLKVVVPASSTENDYVTPTVAYEVGGWTTGQAELLIDVVKQTNPCSLRVRINAVTEGDCSSISESTPWTEIKTISATGIDTTLIPQYNWTTASPLTDMMQIQFEWTNAVAESEDTIYIQVGSNDSRLEHEIGINRGVEPPQQPGNCLGELDTLNSEDEGTPANWISAPTVDMVWENLQDDVDDNYDSTASLGQRHRVIYDGNSMAAGSTVDTIFLVGRVKKGNGGGRHRIRAELVMNGKSSSTACWDGLWQGKSTWDNFTSHFTGFPLAFNNCGTAFGTSEDLARVDSLEFELYNSDGSPWATEVEIIICYTEPAEEGEIPARRRRLLRGRRERGDPNIWADSYPESIDLRKGAKRERWTFPSLKSGAWLWR